MFQTLVRGGPRTLVLGPIIRMIGRLVLLGALAIEGAQGFALVSVPAATNLRARPAASTARGSAFSVRMSGAPGGDK